MSQGGPDARSGGPTGTRWLPGPAARPRLRPQGQGTRAQSWSPLPDGSVGKAPGPRAVSSRVASQRWYLLRGEATGVAERVQGGGHGQQEGAAGAGFCPRRFRSPGAQQRTRDGQRPRSAQGGAHETPRLAAGRRASVPGPRRPSLAPRVLATGTRNVAFPRRRLPSPPAPAKPRAAGDGPD